MKDTLKRKMSLFIGTFILVLFSPCVSFADTTSKISSGDTTWILASSALVLLMTPGLAFFYGGLVRTKNVITTMLQVVSVILVVSLQWVVIGYSLAFGPDVHHIIGNLSWFMMRGVGAAPDSDYASTIPIMVFSIFQMMFAIITPALIVGG